MASTQSILRAPDQKRSDVNNSERQMYSGNLRYSAPNVALTCLFFLSHFPPPSLLPPPPPPPPSFNCLANFLSLRPMRLSARLVCSIKVNYSPDERLRCFNYTGERRSESKLAPSSTHTNLFCFTRQLDSSNSCLSGLIAYGSSLTLCQRKDENDVPRQQSLSLFYHHSV